MYYDIEEVYRLEWDIQVDGRARRAEAMERYGRSPEKLEMIEGRICGTYGDRLALLGLLLENVGLKAAIRLAPADRWRVALEMVEREV